MFSPLFAAFCRNRLSNLLFDITTGSFSEFDNSRGLFKADLHAETNLSFFIGKNVAFPQKTDCFSGTVCTLSEERSERHEDGLSFHSPDICRLEGRLAVVNSL